MASQNKKRAFDIKQSADNDNTEEVEGDETINLDFEARNPDDRDFHGIKKLLSQCFLKANIDISECANTIISQNFVGSVIYQSEVSETSDDDDCDIEDIYGIISVLNISNKKSKFVEQVREYLIKNDSSSKIENLLNNSKFRIGLIINERFINIPPQISLPSFQSLWNEIDQAKLKNSNFDFSHYILISKTYSTLSLPSAKTNRTNEELLFVNQEEEIFLEDSEFNTSFSVKDQHNEGVSGSWSESDVSMEPLRTIIVICATKLSTIMSKLSDALQIAP